MLGRAWLPLGVAVLLLAVVLRQVPLLLVALLLLLSVGVARLWARYALRRLEYARRLSARRAFVGEEVALEVRVGNRKLLPLPWVEVQEEVPADVAFLQGWLGPSHLPRRRTLTALFSLGWYHGVTRRYRVRCLRRGLYLFGPARVRSGDLFGLFQREVEVPASAELLVYPRVVPLAELGLPSRDPFGDLRVRRHLHRDPLRTAGVRPYAPGDPRKHIHWKATSRTGHLQSRVFEPTTSVDLALFLDVRTVPAPSWEHIPVLLDAAVTACASIAAHAVGRGYQVGLYVNQFYRRASPLIRLLPGSSPQHLQRMLEALAQVEGPEVMSMARLVQREATSLPWGATLAVVTAVPTEALLAELVRLRRAGRRVVLLLVGHGDAPAPHPAGVPVYPLRDAALYGSRADGAAGDGPLPPSRTGEGTPDDLGEAVPLGGGL